MIEQVQLSSTKNSQRERQRQNCEVVYVIGGMMEKNRQMIFFC